MVWNDLKRDMEDKHCTTINTLRMEIRKWWKAHQNDFEYCNKKFNHIYSAIDRCIITCGRATGL